MSDIAPTCTKCGLDLSAAKRFKDSKGRAFCGDCAAALRAKAAAKLGAGSLPAVAAPASPPPDPEDGTIALADGPAQAAAPRPASDPSELELCPDCGLPMTADRPICKGCGFNRATGRHMGNPDLETTEDGDPSAKRPKKHRPKPCKKCGYDLTGLKTGKCPECGTTNVRMAHYQETESQMLRAMYLKPLIMTVVGLAFACGVYALRHEPIPFYLFYYAAAVPVGFLVYVGCSIAFIGFDEPLGVTFVRIAGVLAVADAFFAAIDAIPFLGWYAWPLEGIIYAILLMQVMEIDFEDARIVALVTFVVHIALGFAALWVWQTYL